MCACAPLALRRTDRDTGQTEIVEVPCGARLDSKCKPCAQRNRRLRIQQLREGWHLADEPAPPVEVPDAEVRAAVALRAELTFERAQSERVSAWEQVADLDAGIAWVDEWLSTRRVRGGLAVPATTTTGRRHRSTRRRTDATELPRRPVEARTTGRTYAGKGAAATGPRCC